MWDQLPELILIQLFGYLDSIDRVNVAQVCSHWAHCLAAPSLWRRCKVNIDKDLSLFVDSVAVNLVINYGKHMRSLELAWSRPYDASRRDARNDQIEAGSYFVNLIQSQGVQLREIILTDWTHSRKWGNCAKLIYQLANLLALQKNLKTLSLINANMCLIDVLRLIAIVAKVSGGYLTALDLQGAFKEWQRPYCNSRYLKILGRLEALSHLSLDYSALSDGVLNALANGTSKNLLTLHVSIRDSDSRQHRVDNAAWKNLTDRCPLLAVSYSIVNIPHHEDISHLLLPNVPLAKFQMYGGHWDQSRSRNYRATVGLLINHYTETLIEVMLQLRNNREMLDDLLITMLTRCKRLKHLQYDGIMRNIDTIRDICQLQTDRKTHFQTIHVKPKNVNLKNRALLQDIGHQFNREMSDRRIDFRIENFF